MKRIVFMGTPAFSVPILQRLLQFQEITVVGVVTQPDRPKGRKRVLTPSPVKEEAEKHALPVLQPERLNTAEGIQQVLDLRPDLIVTAAYGQLVPKAILDAPPAKCVNVHASLLPELRGGAPIHYAIMQEKKETGISIMYMAEKLDAGPVIAQSALPITTEDHVGSLHEKLSVLGADLLLRVLPDLLENKVVATPQDSTKATFASNITRDQEIIDWSQPNHKVAAHIRGLHPWPVAFTEIKDQVMKIWWGESIEMTTDQPPGTILSVDKHGVSVACGQQSVLVVTDIQPAGKKRMPAADFARGQASPLTPGVVLGGSH
ncbi:methionyl-tRNA formyltransferase [Aureibacillus halotolerans]|uniref:Methionyl-tRNA formyltransferase n=1 Tax=Aureibacillus halotolerans TaxID=1508390 RepID=A0A4R6UBL2_9BACI|nr:methionyl-tRNA formyltransferase [Aureibacillus halotolerans]TDQ42369.1 methionyl-tRNA formyltransferase [Aureibacillus halotolerans]